MGVIDRVISFDGIVQKCKFFLAIDGERCLFVVVLSMSEHILQYGML